MNFSKDAFDRAFNEICTQAFTKSVKAEDLLQRLRAHPEASKFHFKNVEEMMLYLRTLGYEAAWYKAEHPYLFHYTFK